MENISTNPGLQHLAEKIFGYLNLKDLENCREINQSSKKILDNPMFWLKKFRGLSKENQDDWTKIIQSMRNTEKEMEFEQNQCCNEPSMLYHSCNSR